MALHLSQQGSMRLQRIYPAVNRGFRLVMGLMASSRIFDNLS
jgi:hypothetical protein